MPGSANIGSELAGYRLEALLGRGGMGVVYRAHDLALDRDVALKLLAPHLADDVSFRERFLTESRVAASLEHPNVVPIHDAGEIDGQLYIAMRLVEGSDLKQVLREGPLEPARAVRVARADRRRARRRPRARARPPRRQALERAARRARARLPRRLRPQPAASATPGAPLGAAQSLGTIDYVAPEQIRGEEVDGRADLYSLGCLLYECLTGRAAVRPRHRLGRALRPPGGGAARPAGARGRDAQGAGEGARRPLPDLRASSSRRRARRWESPSRGAAAGRSQSAAVGLALIAAALLGFFLTRGGGAAGAARADACSGSTQARTASRPPSPWATARPPSPWEAGVSGSPPTATARSGSSTRGPGGPTKVAAVGRPFALTIHDGNAYVAAAGPGQFTGNVAKFDAVDRRSCRRHQGLACSLASGTYGVWVAGCPERPEAEHRRRDPAVPRERCRPLRRAAQRRELSRGAAGHGRRARAQSG